MKIRQGATGVKKVPQTARRWTVRFHRQGQRRPEDDHTTTARPPSQGEAR